MNQTDAPINHGNSGGRLLDRTGRVVGVNAQIEGGTVDANAGVGFAVPSNTARGVDRELIADGKVEHAFLGVRLATIDPAVAALVRDLPSHGAVVTLVVKGSPAAAAGLKAATQAVTVAGESVPVGGDTIFTSLGYWFVALAVITASAAVAGLAKRLSLFAILASLTAGSALVAVGYLATRRRPSRSPATS